ncbi:glutathione S-transferase 1-like [Halichondria panicea]|uniref:glutathione S-transferase 1-like n=1 Tax=Halichondria panicea TaxID=6063 RepID=UPI00312B6894
MPSYKLYYFPGRGRAEVSRFIFKQAEVDFEDVRIGGEDWAKFKPSTPYGSMPVLEVDGQMLGGSGSMQRYLAEKFGLAGSNDFENAEIDSIVDAIRDLAQELSKFYFEKDEAKKTELLEKLKNETVPKFLGIFEKLISSNASGWIYGSKVTYADFTLYNVMGAVKMGAAEALDSFPAVKKNTEAVEALPNIAKWLKERPESQF